jgi:hypothetical protein
MYVKLLASFTLFQCVVTSRKPKKRVCATATTLVCACVCVHTCEQWVSIYISQSASVCHVSREFDPLAGSNITSWDQASSINSLVPLIPNFFSYSKSKGKKSTQCRGHGNVHPEKSEWRMYFCGTEKILDTSKKWFVFLKLQNVDIFHNFHSLVRQFKSNCSQYRKYK